MFDTLIETFGLRGARPEFYTVWPGGEETDFTRWLSRAYLEDINARYTHLAQEPFEALCEAARELAARPELCAFAAGAHCAGIHTVRSHLSLPPLVCDS